MTTPTGDLPTFSVGMMMQNDTHNWHRPASWPSMNTVNPRTRGPQLVAISAICIALALGMVSLRLYTRFRITRYMGSDDWLIILAVTCSFIQFTLHILASMHGFYRHIWDVPASDFVAAKRIGLAIQSFYPWILGFIKVSILFFYLRLSASPTFRIFVWIFIVFMSLYTVSSSLAILFQCWPFHVKLDTVEGQCVNFIALNYTVATLNIITDVLVYMLSWIMCRDLKVPTGQKLAVMAIFSVGALVCVFSGLRFYYLRDYWNSSDPTWVAFMVSAMSALEANIAIVTACIPAVKPLINKIFPRTSFLRTLNASSNGKSGGCMFSRAGGTTLGGSDLEKLDMDFDTTSFATTVVSTTGGGKGLSVMERMSQMGLSQEDIGFPDGFDGPGGARRTSLSQSDAKLFALAEESPVTPPLNSASEEVPRIGEKVPRMKSTAWDGWIDKEIDMAEGGMDIEEFKRGNATTRMDLHDALRGGPVGIIPDVPGDSRRPSMAPFAGHGWSNPRELLSGPSCGPKQLRGLGTVSEKGSESNSDID